MIRVQAFLLAVFFCLVSCTKSAEPPKNSLEQVKQAIGDLDKVAFEAKLIVPEKYKKKIKKVDSVLWDLKDSSGEYLAGGLMPVKTFPMNIQVLGKHLKKDVDPNAPLIFSARIVAYGEEGQPPNKSQLYSIVGSSTATDTDLVEPKGVKSSALAKAVDKISHIQFKKITIGSQTDAMLGVGLF
ncbi:MAG: hypothetical protein M9962_06410 [Oligoflexia bacterium]|nr:hypothetical protein [Oligoflexia bacterium]